MSCDKVKWWEALLILQAFCHFTSVTAHSPTLPLLYLCHSSFSNPSVASPMPQLIPQPFFSFSYITGFSLTSPGEPPMWKAFNHPPCSPDLAHSHFNVFLHLRKFLSGQQLHFRNDREVEMSVTKWFQYQVAGFYDTGIQKLVPGMTNVSIQEVNILKIAECLLYLFQ